jgi:hypothetical protein
LKIRFVLLSLFLTFVCFACSSKPTFKPEVGGGGAVFSRGGVVYSIPPQNPVLKMKLVSMVIPKETMVHVTMFFLRKGPPAGEYLDPKEQFILLPDSKSNIYPARVHASAVGKPLIKLAEVPKQAVELLFPVPEGGHQYPHINLHWKIHYNQDGQERTMAETERFDYVEKDGPQMGVGHYYGDLEFPYGGYAPLPMEWATPGWLWW